MPHPGALHDEMPARTLPSRGSASGPMGPKWSPATVTKILPLQALARPARTARSLVYASSGLSWFAMRATCAQREARYSIVQEGDFRTGIHNDF